MSIIFSSPSPMPSNAFSDTSKARGGGGKVHKRSRSSSSAPARLPCNTCGKTFSRRDNLMTHQRVHTDERPYKCVPCGKAFRWMSALRHHEEMHRRRELKMKMTEGNCLEKKNSKKGGGNENEIVLDLILEFGQFAPDAFDLGLPSAF